MAKLFAALCRLEGDLIRLVYIADEHVAAAMSSFYGQWPFPQDATISFHEVTGSLVDSLALEKGQMQEWWLGDTVRTKRA